MGRYAPSAIDRVSAARLTTGDESIPSMTYVLHAASASKRELRLMDGYSILLRPYETLASSSTISSAADVGSSPAFVDTTTITLGTAPPVSVSIVGPAPLLMSLTIGDLRDNLDTIVVWLRTLLMGRSALERAFSHDPRPVLLKRMGDLARDAGNARLANTIDEVVSAHTLEGYAQAFDWTLVRIREAKPPAARPGLTEAFILDLFLELWAPSVDAGLVTAPDLRD